MSDLYQRHFGYDAQTGKLWHTTSKGRCKSGQEVTAKDTTGYIRVQFQGRKILGHRLAWILYYKEQPPKYIDHINGVQDDNRICNLRAATHSENQHNRKKYANNTSGIKGISKTKGGYAAHIRHDGIKYSKWSKDLSIVQAWLIIKRQALHGAYAHD